MAKSLSEKIGKKISINNCEKIKETLSKKLSQDFGIDRDSFYSYKEHGYYKPIFIWEPEPIMRGTGETFVMSHDNIDDNFGYKVPED